MLVTAGWDKQLKFWDMRQSHAIHSQTLNERVFALSTMHPLLVVGTADRSMYIYDLNMPQ